MDKAQFAQLVCPLVYTLRWRGPEGLYSSTFTSISLDIAHCQNHLENERSKFFDSSTCFIKITHLQSPGYVLAFISLIRT